MNSELNRAQNASKDKIAFIIAHPEMGIYVGSCLGLGFWTKLDAGGQDAAVTFNSPELARAYVKTWESNNDPDAYRYIAVIPDRDVNYVSFIELKAYALDAYLPEKLIDG